MPLVLKLGWFCSSECLAMSGNNMSQQEGMLLASTVKGESRSVVSDSLHPHGPYTPWNSPGQNTGVGGLSLLQGIFPTQELYQGLLHCRWILEPLSYQGSPGIETRADAQHPAVPRTAPHSRVSQRRASVVPRVKAGQALEHKHWGEAAAFLESFEVSSLFLSSFPPTLSSSSLPPPLSFLSQVYIYTHTSFLLQSGICLDRMTLGNKRILHLSLLLLTL